MFSKDGELLAHRLSSRAALPLARYVRQWRSEIDSTGRSLLGGKAQAEWAQLMAALKRNLQNLIAFPERNQFEIYKQQAQQARTLRSAKLRETPAAFSTELRRALFRHGKIFPGGISRRAFALLNLFYGGRMQWTLGNSARMAAAHWAFGWVNLRKERVKRRRQGFLKCAKGRSGWNGWDHPCTGRPFTGWSLP